MKMDDDWGTPIIRKPPHIVEKNAGRSWYISKNLQNRYVFEGKTRFKAVG